VRTGQEYGSLQFCHGIELEEMELTEKRAESEEDAREELTLTEDDRERVLATDDDTSDRTLAVDDALPLLEAERGAGVQQFPTFHGGVSAPMMQLCAMVVPPINSHSRGSRHPCPAGHEEAEEPPLPPLLPPLLPPAEEPSSTEAAFDAAEPGVAGPH